VAKLVKVFGYPPSLYQLEFDYAFMVRGLIVDKKRGNVIKVDRHKYVKIAYHGFRHVGMGSCVCAWVVVGVYLGVAV
jgi:hypothetical protein